MNRHFNVLGIASILLISALFGRAVFATETVSPVATAIASLNAHGAGSAWEGSLKVGPQYFYSFIPIRLVFTPDLDVNGNPRYYFQLNLNSVPWYLLWIFEKDMATVCPYTPRTLAPIPPNLNGKSVGEIHVYACAKTPGDEKILSAEPKRADTTHVPVMKFTLSPDQNTLVIIANFFGLAKVKYTLHRRDIGSEDPMIWISRVTP